MSTSCPHNPTGLQKNNGNPIEAAPVSPSSYFEYTNANILYDRQEQKMTSSMDIVKKFDALCNEGKFEEAAEMLTDDFQFTNPRTKLDKAKWLKDFPAMHADAPTFEEFEQGATDKQITRKGKKKMMMVNISMMETWELTDDGKIKSITGAKA